MCERVAGSRVPRFYEFELRSYLVLVHFARTLAALDVAGRVCGPSCCTCPTYSAAAGRLIKSRLVAASPPFDDSGSGAEMRSGLRAIIPTTGEAPVGWRAEQEDTLIAALNLSRALLESQKLDEAVEFLNVQAPLAQRVLGENDTALQLCSYHALALIEAAVNYDEFCSALAMLEDVGKKTRRLLGAQHPFARSVEYWLSYARNPANRRPDSYLRAMNRAPGQKRSNVYQRWDVLARGVLSREAWAKRNGR